MASPTLLLSALFLVSLCLTHVRAIAPTYQDFEIAPTYQDFQIAPTPQAPEVAPPTSFYSIDYLFQFGDSISDTGNLVIESPVQAHNFGAYPYGMTMHNPTGRCSDGLLMIDQFAKFFDKPLLNPYLAKGDDFSQGVNFAVAGSTALDSDTLHSKGIISPVTTSSLNVQLDWFKTHLDTICDDALDCWDKLSRSLVLIETGGNDYNYAMLQGKTMDQVREMVPQVVETIINAAKQVISYGVTRVYIPGNFPIGCLPIYKATFENEYTLDGLNCLDGLNAFARYHNDHLKEAIKELQQEYPEVTVVYGDYYSALSSVLKNAGALGFDVSSMFKACCGSGDNDYNFDLTKICGTEGFEVCADPNKYISWDGIHMTQQAYKRMSQWLLPRLAEELKKA
ncbi:GDSL esterase/lipase At5g03980-like [Silene latifolia]|uniref:GDSL esterase/lipase At5g03980-like n=1 Tax=Silene latifolia TaxID=37657 RepID=UPI003D78A9D0